MKITKKNNNQANKPNRKFNQLTILESLFTGWYVPSKVIFGIFLIIRGYLYLQILKKIKDFQIKYLDASYVFNCIDEQAPEYLQVFERVNESHHYNTRHSVNALILPKVG